MFFFILWSYWQWWSQGHKPQGRGQGLRTSKLFSRILNDSNTGYRVLFLM